MKKKNPKLISFLVCVSVLLLGSRAYSCGCGGRTSLSESFESSDAVAIGHIVSFLDSGLIEFENVTVYKGNLGKTIMLFQLATSGSWDFQKNQIGKEYLFYLRYDSKQQAYNVISGCGRSREVKNAIDDISWLNQLPYSGKRTRIAGFISDENDEPIKNVAVKVFGKEGKFTVVTDDSGLYEVWDLPPGNYGVVPIAPNGLAIDRQECSGKCAIHLLSIEDPFFEYHLNVGLNSSQSLDFTLKKQ